MTGVSRIAWLGRPIDARPLFGSELRALLDTLRGLNAADWRRPALPDWTVHDLAAHLLGDFEGRLGANRGAFLPGETLAAFIHRTNQELVARRADDSPALLVDALESAGTRAAERFAAADLDAPALGVSWAGVDPAPAWLDIAREFTEYWTHRQQIRHAVGLPTDSAPEVMSMVLDTFMRALPHTLRRTTAPLGTRIDVIAEGEGGGSWTVTATAGRWTLAAPPTTAPTASVLLDTESAWRLCTRAIDPATALGRARTQGEHRLAAAACEVVSIVR